MPEGVLTDDGAELDWIPVSGEYVSTAEPVVDALISFATGGASTHALDGAETEQLPRVEASPPAFGSSSRDPLMMQWILTALHQI